ncbi:MAG: globin [Armatimonadota bacterium]|nr:globin [Armatimonadota bacterium]
MNDETTEIYAQVGSDAPFFALVEAFYAGVEQDPPLRSLYPDDLTHAKEYLALFLIQRFGGHGGYGEKRGHPRLRMRHVPFQIGEAEREAWLRHMFAALEQTEAFKPYRESMRRYFADSAAFLVNKAEIPAIERPVPVSE